MPDVFEHTKPNATVKIEEWYFDNCHIKIGDHCFDIKLTKEQFNEMNEAVKSLKKDSATICLQ